MKARHNVTEREIAERSKLHAATVYRMVDPKSTIRPSLPTVYAIASAFGEQMPTGDGAAPTFAEGDASLYEGEALAPGSANQSVWTVRTRALELAGYLPGDLILLDQAAAPRAGDIVIAQIYDFTRGTAETKVRFYDGLFLSVRTMDPALAERPIAVDGERATIMGRVIRMVRVTE